jgi:ketosteroid isomerase-like protein
MGEPPLTNMRLALGCLAFICITGSSKTPDSNAASEDSAAVSTARPTTPDSNAIQRTIADIADTRDSLEQALARGEADAVLKYYEPGASEYNGGMWVTHDAVSIRDMYASDTARASARNFDTQFEVHDGIAIERGQYQEFWTRKDAGENTPSQTIGDVLAVWRKRADGAWQISYRTLIPRESGAIDPASR